MDLPGFAPIRREMRTANGWIIFIQAPAIAGAPEVMVQLTDDQFKRYRQWRDRKGLIQDLLPDLSVSEREMLMTGLDDENFKRLTRESNE